MKLFTALFAILPATLARTIDLQPDLGAVIADKWIVRVPVGVDVDSLLAEATSTLRTTEEITPDRTFDFTGFKGFSITASEGILQSLQSAGFIDGYEPDREVSIAQGAVETQEAAPWGLARVSSRVPRTSSYRYASSPGEGTFIYVLDSGVNIDHVDFEGRASHGAAFSADGHPRDGTGHGTHVAGSAAGRVHGVAKAASIINVKVIASNNLGRLSDILAGIEWATNDAVSKGRIGRAVANLSIATVSSQVVDDAVVAMSRAGLFVVVAAGNARQDTSLYSPARAPEVCNVAASNREDRIWFATNFGPRVDLWAPGQDIVSAGNRSNTHTYTTSGTSMAAPHVAGLGAYLMALEGPSRGNALCDRLKELSTLNAIVDTRGSPNRLAYNGIDEL